MGMKCANCGKGVMYGHNVSHSKRRTRKIFKPNLHSVRVSLGENSRKMRLCTKCLRMYRALEKQQSTIEVVKTVTETPAPQAQ